MELAYKNQELIEIDDECVMEEENQELQENNFKGLLKEEGEDEMCRY